MRHKVDFKIDPRIKFDSPENKERYVEYQKEGYAGQLGMSIGHSIGFDKKANEAIAEEIYTLDVIVFKTLRWKEFVEKLKKYIHPSFGVEILKELEQK